MVAIVVPFRGSHPKARLAPLEPPARGQLAHAMLADVLAACCAVGATAVVSADPAARLLAHELGAAALPDEGLGQGQAVAAALARLEPAPLLVVNADLPCARPHDLRMLLGATPPDGVALVAARDGTTNALSLSHPAAFAPLYGPGSAERFRRHAAGRGRAAVVVTLPNLRDDVDTLADLRRIAPRAGVRTRAALATLGLAA